MGTTPVLRGESETLMMHVLKATLKWNVYGHIKLLESI